LQNDSPAAIEEQQPEEEDSDKVQESWMPVDKEQLLEPEIEKFHACLSPDSMNGDHISEDLHGMIEGSQGRQDYIESWFKTVIGSQYSHSSVSSDIISIKAVGLSYTGTYQRVYFKPAYEFIPRKRSSINTLF
jgi:hypothetical protein